jgi:type II secretory pathway pseudopilin PulG
MMVSHGRELGLRRRNGSATQDGFTLIDVVVTSAILILVASTAMYALTSINRYASFNRVQAAAESIVQNQIDQILIRGPYVPTNTPPDIPPILTSGTTVINNLPVFTDPESGNPLVIGTLTTVIQDTGAKCNGITLYVLKAAVTLDFTFRAKKYTIAMDTLRAPD